MWFVSNSILGLSWVHHHGGQYWGEDPADKEFKCTSMKCLVLVHMFTLEERLTCIDSVGFFPWRTTQFMISMVTKPLWGCPHFPLVSPLVTMQPYLQTCFLNYCFSIKYETIGRIQRNQSYSRFSFSYAQELHLWVEDFFLLVL